MSDKAPKCQGSFEGICAAYAELEAKCDRLAAENADLRKDRERLEWLGSYLWMLTGGLWPQNETTRAMCETLFKAENWREAIDAARDAGGQRG